MAKLRISRAEVNALINIKRSQGGKLVAAETKGNTFRAVIQFVTKELIITHTSNGWCETQVRDFNPKAQEHV